VPAPKRGTKAKKAKSRRTSAAKRSAKR
jgi:hypothetical protein